MDQRRKNLERHCYAANLRAHSFVIAVGDLFDSYSQSDASSIASLPKGTVRDRGTFRLQRRRSGEEVKRVPVSHVRYIY